MRFGTTELLIILALVVLLFGVGRISKVAGEMGKGIKAFKDGLAGDDKDKDKTAASAEEKPKDE